MSQPSAADQAAAQAVAGVLAGDQKGAKKAKQAKAAGTIQKVLPQRIPIAAERIMLHGLCAACLLYPGLPAGC